MAPRERRFHLGTGSQNPTTDAGYTTAGVSRSALTLDYFSLLQGESIYELLDGTLIVRIKNIARSSQLTTKRRHAATKGPDRVEVQRFVFQGVVIGGHQPILHAHHGGHADGEVQITRLVFHHRIEQAGEMRGHQKPL